MNNATFIPVGPKIGVVDDALLRTFVNSVRDYAMFMLDPAGYVISWNPGVEAIKGYRAEEIIGLHFSCFYPQEALERKLPELELRVAAAEGRFEDEGWRVRKDGSLFWANVIIAAMRDEQGRLLGYAKLTRDLTERRKQQELLRQSEERLRLLIEGIKDYAIFMLDPNGIVVSWNSGACTIHGYNTDEIIGAHFSRFYPPEAVKAGFPEQELHVATLESKFEDEGWRTRKDGSRFWASVLITAMRDSSGTLLGFSKITRDLTERRQHEQELMISEERFRLLVDGVTEYSLIMLDRDGTVSSWNSGAERIHGYASTAIIGKHFSRLYSAEDIADNRPWHDLMTARNLGRITQEGWRSRRDGTLFWSANSITALYDSEDRLYGFAKVTQDLTQRRQAETLADTAQRMHEFIAMLAHELRNPIAPIRNAVALMGRKGLQDPTLEAMRQMIDRQSLHLARLLDDLLDVNRVARGKMRIEKQQVDLCEVLTRAMETSRPLIDTQQHQLSHDMPSGLLPVSGDAVRLTQAFVNLLNNAAKYTPPGGAISVQVDVGDGEVEVHVRDTGKGLEKHQLERVFDLFVQLEPNGHDQLSGLGVGLALVRRIIELHAGSVQAFSPGPGRGSDFVVRLPLSAPVVPSVNAPARPPRETQSRLRVLVADDNRDAADSLRLLLETMGHSVHVVYDGRAALAAAQSYDPELVLLDIGMPHVSGYEVARTLRQQQDGARRPLLVAITGWGQEADRQLAHEAGFDHHCAKPIGEEVLRAVLAEAAAISARAC